MESVLFGLIKYVYPPSLTENSPGLAPLDHLLCRKRQRGKLDI